MLNKKDGVSLVILVVALVLINVFGNSLDEMMWPKFTLLGNCILSQGMFITLLNLFRSSSSRAPSVGLILLSLLTGLIAFVIIITSDMGRLDQILILFLQAMITYAESLLLRKEIKGENGKQI